MAVYTDGDGRPYTSVCYANRNRVRPGNLYPGLEPAKYPWQMTRGDLGGTA